MNRGPRVSQHTRLCARTGAGTRLSRTTSSIPVHEVIPLLGLPQGSALRFYHEQRRSVISYFPASRTKRSGRDYLETLTRGSSATVAAMTGGVWTKKARPRAVTSGRAEEPAKNEDGPARQGRGQKTSERSFRLRLLTSSNWTRCEEAQFEVSGGCERHRCRRQAPKEGTRSSRS